MTGSTLILAPRLRYLGARADIEPAAQRSAPTLPHHARLGRASRRHGAGR
jgi:hypothetical protein